MVLYLIRHAQSANNALPESQRVEDPSLTELGHQQARCLADSIGQLRLTRLFTSPFMRALETTEHLRQATGIVPVIWTELHEQGGCYQGYTHDSITGRPGMSRSEIARRFPQYEIATTIDERGWWRCQPYETLSQASERAAALLCRTREFGFEAHERVAYIMHADFKRLFLERFHRAPLVDPWNTSVSQISIGAEMIVLESYNDVSHLPPTLVTC